MAGGSDLMTFPDCQALLSDPNVFIADSGATSDTTQCDIRMTDVVKADSSDSITDTSGNVIKASGVGTLKGMIIDKTGNEVTRAKIENMAYLPKSKFGLISLTQRMQNGWKLIGDEEPIKLKKGNVEMVFDIKIYTPKGAIYCIYIKRDVEFGAVGPNLNRIITKKQAHAIMGHNDPQMSKKSCEYLGYQVKSGVMDPCEACAIAKARQKNLPTRVEVEKKVRRPKVKANVPNGRIYLDLTTIKTTKLMKEEKN